MLGHEKIPKTHAVATLLTEMPGIRNGKKISCISGVSLYRFLEGCDPQDWSNGKFTLNLCDAQVFKTKNSEKNC